MPATKKPLTTSQWIVVVLSALAVMLLVLNYQERVSSFEASQRALARTASTEVASQVAFILAERQRQVMLYAEDHRALLQQLLTSPDKPEAYQALERNLKRTFPDVFAFTITDARGQPLIADFEGFVGETCEQDIRAYAQSGQYLARIHPNNHAYHYDVMADWQSADGARHMLMVSFEPRALSQLLRSIEAPGHELMLLSNSEPPLLEVTAQGARDKTPRSDYRLKPEELRRLLASRPVDHSLWNVAVLAQPGFFESFRQRNLLTHLLALVALGLVVGASLVLLRREEHRRWVAEQTREHLFSVVTHEMRTPVTAMSGTLGLMRHGVLGELPPALLDSISLLERNAERLRRLIDDLLESRRIESGQLSLQKTDVDLALCVRETLEQLRDYARQSTVDFAFTSLDAPLWVHADPVRLQQICTNLLSNAAKFSPQGGTVRVSLERTGKSMVRVSVHDDGPGIPADFQPRVFGKFARGPAQPNRPIASTGLGLSIVKALVEAHGGHVGFESVPGQGTTFHFELPLLPPSAAST